jgi:hypothetical protein
MSTTAGYSSTPLHNKLGLRPGIKVRAVGMPPAVRELIEAGIVGVHWVPAKSRKFDAAHLFATRFTDLQKELVRARKALPATGFIWVSWPKRSSAVVTDISEGRVRELALSLKLVDIKVCAVTEIWSGLKLVIAIKERR